jgi:hypothetical protein
MIGTETSEQVVLENLGGEIRAPDHDDGAQREVKPASDQSERDADHQRQADRPGRHPAQSFIKTI